MPNEEEVGHEPKNGNCCACPLKRLLSKAGTCGEMVVKWNYDHHKVLHQDYHLKMTQLIVVIFSHIQILSPGREVGEGKCCVHGRCFEDCLHSC